MGDEARGRLDADGISSPIQLRLTLFNYVNERYAGFLNAEIERRPCGYLPKYMR